LLGTQVGNVIFASSGYEAKNYGKWIQRCAKDVSSRQAGRFLFGILSDLWRWHQDEAAYLQDNRTKSGNKVTVLPGFLKNWSLSKDVVDAKSVRPWTEFKLILQKWHKKLTKVAQFRLTVDALLKTTYQCLVECIQSAEFMHVYNAVIVLMEILPVFPMMAVLEPSGTAIAEAIAGVLKVVQRDDLKVACRA
jgi:THO complex subunit 2